jgi:hypothetical protein
LLRSGVDADFQLLRGKAVARRIDAEQAIRIDSVGQQGAVGCPAVPDDLCRLAVLEFPFAPQGPLGIAQFARPEVLPGTKLRDDHLRLLRTAAGVEELPGARNLGRRSACIDDKILARLTCAPAVLILERKFEMVCSFL